MERGRGRGRGRRRTGDHHTSFSQGAFEQNFPIEMDLDQPEGQQQKQDATQSTPSHPLSSSFDSISSHITPRSERPARNNSHYEFSFRSPDNVTMPMTNTKKRARTVDAVQDLADETTPKGGHQLRKRARVDYTQGRIDDDIAPFLPRSDLTKATTSTARSRKRYATTELTDDDSDGAATPLGPATKRRRSEKFVTTNQATPARRKNTARKSPVRKSPIRKNTQQSYLDQQDEVQDAIVVGAPLEDSERSSFLQSDSPQTASDDQPSSPAPQSTVDIASQIPLLLAEDNKLAIEPSQVPLPLDVNEDLDINPAQVPLPMVANEDLNVDPSQIPLPVAENDELVDGSQIRLVGDYDLITDAPQVQSPQNEHLEAPKVASLLADNEPTKEELAERSQYEVNATPSDIPVPDAQEPPQSNVTAIEHVTSENDITSAGLTNHQNDESITNKSVAADERQTNVTTTRVITQSGLTPTSLTNQDAEMILDQPVAEHQSKVATNHVTAPSDLTSDDLTNHPEVETTAAQINLSSDVTATNHVTSPNGLTSAGPINQQDAERSLELSVRAEEHQSVAATNHVTTPNDFSISETDRKMSDYESDRESKVVENSVPVKEQESVAAMTGPNLSGSIHDHEMSDQQPNHEAFTESVPAEEHESNVAATNHVTAQNDSVSVPDPDMSAHEFHLAEESVPVKEQKSIAATNHVTAPNDLTSSDSDQVEMSIDEPVVAKEQTIVTTPNVTAPNDITSVTATNDVTSQNELTTGLTNQEAEQSSEPVAAKEHQTIPETTTSTDKSAPANEQQTTVQTNGSTAINSPIVRIVSRTTKKGVPSLIIAVRKTHAIQAILFPKNEPATSLETTEDSSSNEATEYQHQTAGPASLTTQPIQPTRASSTVEPTTEVDTMDVTAKSKAELTVSMALADSAEEPQPMSSLAKFYEKARGKKGPSSTYEAGTVAHPVRSGRVLRSSKADSANIPSRPSSPPPVRRPKPKVARRSDLIKADKLAAERAAKKRLATKAEPPARIVKPPRPTVKWTTGTFYQRFYKEHKYLCSAKGVECESPYKAWTAFMTLPEGVREKMVKEVYQQAEAERAKGALSDKAKGKQPATPTEEQSDVLGTGGSMPEQDSQSSALDQVDLVATGEETPELVEDDGNLAEAVASNDEAEDEDPEAYEPTKQYAFPKIRDPSIFEDLKDFATMSTPTLQRRLRELWDYMDPLQEELNTLQKPLDDEENAKRRLQNDKAISNWDARQNLEEPLPVRRHFDDLVKGPPPFEVKGRRAPRPFVDDPVLEYQREQDKVQADAWGFKHSNLPSLIGRQNPAEQRWEMPEPRLRERKQTQKAADLAEEHILEGKRHRKPRVLAEKESTRAGTPVEAARRAKGAGGEAVLGRKRRAGAAAPRQPPSANGTEDEEDAVSPPRAKRLRMVPALEPSASQTGAEESTRPSTSSSNVTAVTAETGESAYSLRDKKPRNYAADNDPEGATRSRKRARGAATEVVVPIAAGPADPSGLAGSSTMGEQEDGQPKKRRRQTKSATSQTAAPKRPLLAAVPLQPAPSSAQVPPLAAPSSSLPPPPGPSYHTFEMVSNNSLSVAPDDDKASATKPARRTWKQAASASRLAGVVTDDDAAVGSAPAVLSPDLVGDVSAQAADAEGSALADAPAATDTEAGRTIQVYKDQAGRTMLSIKFAPSDLQGPLPAAVAKLRNPGVEPSPDRPAKITRLRDLHKQQAAGSAGSANPVAPNTKTPIMRVAPPSRTATALAAGTTNGSTTTNSSPADSGDLSQKSYSEMSKSEKMSFSMRNRWARGEMQGAVEKRKNTLAQKHRAKVATDTLARSSGQRVEPKVVVAASGPKAQASAKRQRATEGGPGSGGTGFELAASAQGGVASGTSSGNAAPALPPSFPQGN